MIWIDMIRNTCHIICSSVLIVVCTSCSSNPRRIEAVTYAQFEQFVSETGYITDAEKFGWSIVQKDVFNFTTVKGANWRKPNGFNTPVSKNLPVTQVSYNDAMAYCNWAETELPTYEQYWELIKNDKRNIVVNYNASISEVSTVNLAGNVWEITASEKGKNIRLAGGSLFCSISTCDGTSKERQLYVDKLTGNIHIGFAVIK